MKALSRLVCPGLPSLWTLIFVLTAATAAASPAHHGLSARLLLDDPDSQQACGNMIPLTLEVQNVDDFPLTMKKVRLIETVKAGHPLQTLDLPAAQNPGPGDPKVAPMPSIDWPAEPSRLRLGELQLQALPAGAKTELSLTLARPQAEGFFSDAVRIDWAYPEGAGADPEVQHDAEATIHYRVDGNCIQTLDVEAFYAASDYRTSFPVVGRGFDKTLDAVSGFANPVLEDRTEAKALPVYEVSSHFGPSLATGADGEPVGPFNNDDDDTFEIEEGEPRNLRYCLRVSYVDNFRSCSPDTTGMKWWRPYCDQRNVPILGLEVSLWDRDEGSSSSDDFIGTYVLHYDRLSDYSCIDFEWQPLARGELLPDVYVTTRLDVRDSEFGAGREAHLCRSDQTSQSSCTDRFIVTWRANHVPDMDSTTYADLDFGGPIGILNRRAMNMAAVQKVLRSYQARHMTGDLNVWWNGNTCQDSNGNPWPCSWDDNWFSLVNQTYRRWDAGPHEAGHSYQKQLFEQHFLSGSGCGASHTMSGVENDACATKEGWADFFSTLTWFTGRSAKDSGDPRYLGFRVEGGTKPFASCASNAVTELQVMRTFWDMFDDNPDGIDLGEMQRWDILQIWDDFPDGTRNHKDREDGNDGGNLWDFHANADSDFQSTIEDAMEHNETDCQSPD